MGKGDTFQSTEVLKIFLESHVISQVTQEHTYSRHSLGMRLLTELNFHRQLFGEWGWEVIRPCSGPASDDPKIPHFCHFLPEALVPIH